MSEVMRPGSLDSERLKLLDRQAVYHEKLQQEGIVDKTFRIMEAHWEACLASSSGRDMPNPANTTFQVVPELDWIEGEYWGVPGHPDEVEYRALGLALRWRDRATQDAVAATEVFIRVAELRPDGGYNLQHDFTSHEVAIVQEMVYELQEAQANGELPDLDRGLSFIGDDIAGYSFDSP